MNNGAPNNLPPQAMPPGMPQIPPEQDIDVTLTLKLSQVNIIIASLDELPHKFSRQVIDAVHQQTLAQVNPQGGGQPKGLGGDLAGKVIN